MEELRLEGGRLVLIRGGSGLDYSSGNGNGEINKFKFGV